MKAPCGVRVSICPYHSAYLQLYIQLYLHKGLYALRTLFKAQQCAVKAQLVIGVVVPLLAGIIAVIFASVTVYLLYLALSFLFIERLKRHDVFNAVVHGRPYEHAHHIFPVL